MVTRLKNAILFTSIKMLKIMNKRNELNSTTLENNLFVIKWQY